MNSDSTPSPQRPAALYPSGTTGAAPSPLPPRPRTAAAGSPLDVDDIVRARSPTGTSPSLSPSGQPRSALPSQAQLFPNGVTANSGNGANDSMQTTPHFSAASSVAPLTSQRSQQQQRRRRHGRRRQRDGGRGLTLCCDAVTVQRDKVEVISNVSGMIRGGRLTAVVNCCGNHSAFYFLSALAGQEEADSGNALLNGTPVTAASYQDRSVLLDEDFAAFENLTVRENLEYAAVMRVANSSQAYTVDDIIHQLLLDNVQHAIVKQCSLYVRRRVSLGKELLLNPTVLLLDQPLQGLATHEAQQYLSILAKIAAPAAADAEARRYEESINERLRATAGGSATPAVEANASTPPPAAVLTASRENDLLSPSSSAQKAGGTRSPSRPSQYAPRPTAARGAGSAAMLSKAAGSAAVAARALTPSPVASSAPDFAAASVSSLAVGNTATFGAANTASATSSASAFGSSGTDNAERIVILSVVQPRWALLKYVDDVLVLDGNVCVYCGPLDDLFKVPLRRRSGSGEDGDGGDVEAVAARDEREAGNSPAVVPLSSNDPQGREKYLHALYRLAAASGDGGGSALPQLFAQTRSAERNRRAIDEYLEECAEGLHALDSWKHERPYAVVQLWYLMKYAVLQVRHNLLMNSLLMLLVIALSVALAALYGTQEGQSGMQNRVGILFFLVSTTLLQSVLAVNTIRKEYLSFQRHRAYGYYSTLTYLIFQVLSCAFVRFLIASVFALVVFLFSNFGEPWKQYSAIFELAVITAVTSFCSYFAVFFVCTVLWTLSIESFVLFAIYIVNLMLAGLILNLATLPRFVQWISFLTVLRLAYESCILTQFIGKSFDCDPDTHNKTTTHAPSHLHMGAEIVPPLHAQPDWLKTVTLSTVEGDTSTSTGPPTCYTGTEYAHFLGFSEHRRWVNVGALAGMSGVIVLCCLSMMALYRPRRKRAAA